MLPVIVQFLFYASPVAYGLIAVTGRMRFVCALNPLSALLEGFRWSLLGCGALRLGETLYAAGTSAGVLVAGMLLFRAMERTFADVI
jgi:lipopolysaccharide transport system permease protein